MKKIFLFFFIVFLSNCSFNDNSKFWTKDVIKKKHLKKLNKIIYKSSDIMSLTFDEYQIYISENNKNTKYPNLNE